MFDDCLRPGFRFKTVTAVLVLLAANLLGGSQARSSPPQGNPQAGAVARGQRMFTCCHSFHCFVYPLVAEMAKAAGIEEHRSVGMSSIGGSRVIQHWDVAEEKNEAKAALRAGKVDVLTLSPIWLPDEGIEKFARLGLEHNPDIRVTVQEFWLPNDTYHPVYPLQTGVKVDHNATNIAELRKQQALYDHDLCEYVRDVNRRLGKDTLVVVPVGQAAAALREKIVAGQAPGLKAEWDLFSDCWGHARSPLRVLDGYCHFAMIYRRSPVGLPLPSDLAKDEKLTDKDKLNRLLQELAWDAVVHHRLSGVKTTTQAACAQMPSAASPKGIARVLQPFIDSRVLAGAVTLVASKDKVLSLEAVGYADVAAKRPMRTDNLFWIASMTKSMTATALMMLVDEGKVNVDDPVEKYLPEFKGQMLAVEEEKGKVVLKKPAHPSTVKNLLTHTSGLVNRPAAGQRWDTTSLRAAVECYAACPLTFEPGSKFEYNNPGINTVGRIIEVVSGMPYEQFMARRLFEPLGMKDTTFWPSKSQLERLAKTYKPNAGRTGLEATSTLPFVDPRTGRRSMPFPAGGLFSTAADVSLFCRMVLCGGTLDGKRYLSEKAVREMTSTQTGSLPVAYGYGWFTDRTPGGPFGHARAHKTDMHVYPRQQLVAVLMVQHTEWRNGDGNKILPAFQQAAIKACEIGSGK